MQPIQFSIFSETARLRQVVVHHPGPEVDLMVPGMMEKLLFDDILYGDLARQEHAQFRQVLAKVADEVLDIQDLFNEALQDERVKQAFIEDLRRLVGLPDDTCSLLREMSPTECARSVIGGVTSGIWSVAPAARWILASSTVAREISDFSSAPGTYWMDVPPSRAMAMRPSVRSRTMARNAAAEPQCVMSSRWSALFHQG